MALARNAETFFQARPTPLFPFLQAGGVFPAVKFV